jgi:hypothetical protein
MSPVQVASGPAYLYITCCAEEESGEKDGDGKGTGREREREREREGCAQWHRLGSRFELPRI